MRPLQALPFGKDASLTDLVAARPAAFTFAELVALSTRDRARRAIARQEIVRLLPDCYVAAQHAHSFLARAHAALTWAGDSAVLAGTSALHAFDFVPAPRCITLTVTRASRPRPPDWIVVARISYPVSTTIVDRMPTATVGFALAQGFADLDPRTRTDVAYRVLRSTPHAAGNLHTALEAMPRVRERRRLARIAAAAAAGAESWLEEQSLTTVFSTAEFASLLRQHTLVCAGRTVRLDLYDPATRTAIELDGAQWHAGEDQRQRDIARDAALAGAGIQTIRFSYRDIVERPEWVRGVVRHALAARARR